MTTTKTAETVDERVVRLAAEIKRMGSAEMSDKRRESVEIAHASGVDDATFVALVTALRCARKRTIVLPAHRLEAMSRGKGWARKGRGSDAEWGERVDGGYEVGPGKWTIGGNDGFSRKGEETWIVDHVTVGGDVWTLAS